VRRLRVCPDDRPPVGVALREGNQHAASNCDYFNWDNYCPARVMPVAIAALGRRRTRFLSQYRSRRPCFCEGPSGNFNDGVDAIERNASSSVVLSSTKFFSAPAAGGELRKTTSNRSTRRSAARRAAMSMSMTRAFQKLETANRAMPAA
jgi:hypothetical protein